MDMEIKGNTAVITGGASGLGEATARRFHDLGGNVVVIDINQQRGEALCSELGSRAAFSLSDVTVPEQVEAGMRLALDRFGTIRMTLNCAGIGPPMKVVGKQGPHDLDHFKNVVNVNLIGTFDVLRLAAFHMSSNPPNEHGERGVIVNVASVAAFEGQIGQAAYSASKAGVVGMTLPIARELARAGIRVCTIAPGLFDTPLLASLPPEVKEVLGKQIPFPSRLGIPVEFALLVQHMVENPMLNGETIRLDGALRMPPK
jgi:NAD(P)-dependent dehydrogenase (short-subunit alcohol dehydrogenase family)